MFLSEFASFEHLEFCVLIYWLLKTFSAANMTEEWLCEKMENLKIKENCLATLTEIQQRLYDTPNLDTKITNHLLRSPEIYNCLEEVEIDVANNINPLEIVCDILSKCLENLSFENKSDLWHLLHRALMHKRARIKALVLNALLKELTTEGVDGRDPTAIISAELLNHILLALQEQETDVGTAAYKILCIVLKYYLDEPTVKSSLLEALKKSDIVRCRVYELAVKIAYHSAVNLEKVEFILDHALSELDNDDVLVQVNILEILVTLAEFNPGLTYLEKRQVFEVLAKRIEDIEETPLDLLLIPGIMKFFGKISAFQPQKVINGYPHMIRCLFESLVSGDTSMLPIAFDTLVNLTYTEHGVHLLEENYPNAMKDVFECFSEYLKNLPIALRIRALDSLSNIFTFEKEVSPEISLILQRWFVYLNSGANDLQFLMVSCRTPFADLRYSALNFVRSLCHYSWGIEGLKNTAGFLEFLLDRSLGFDEPAKYVKFVIISKLADSDAFDVQTNIQLRTYVNEGPFFVPSIMEVAIEGNE